MGAIVLWHYAASFTEVLYVIHVYLSAWNRETVWGSETSVGIGARFRGWLVIIQSAGTCSTPSAEAGCFV